jgi:hypothetical protein
MTGDRERAAVTDAHPTVTLRLQPGQRHPATLAGIEARNQHLRAARSLFFADLSDRGAARELAVATANYFTSTWRFDRLLDMPPARHRGRLREQLWLALKAWPSPPSAGTIRRALCTADFAVDNDGVSGRADFVSHPVVSDQLEGGG